MQPAIDMAAPVNTDEFLSFEEYLERYDSYEGARTEWLAGKVGIYPLSNNLQHNNILGFLHTLLTLLLGMTKLGRVLLAGVPMKYSDEHPAREPDLMVLLTPHLDRITPRYVAGVADIVVEIVSPESVARDRGEKFEEFEAAGVPEYWLFDPLREEAAVYALSADGRYRRVPLDAQGRLVSTVLPGFALDPALLWQAALPDGEQIMAMVLSLTSMMQKP